MADRAYIVSNSETSESRSLRDLVRDILQDITRIIRGEIRLARTEITEKLQKGKKAAVFLGAAAVAGLFAGACLVTCCIAALAIVLPLWLSALLMAVLLGGGAGGAFVMGRQKLDEVEPIPQQTVSTIKDDIEWAKNRTR
jgi:hypothetical protein